MSRWYKTANRNEGNTLQTAASQPHGGIALYKDTVVNLISATIHFNGFYKWLSYKSCSGFCHIRNFTYLSVAKQTDKKSEWHGKSTKNLSISLLLEDFFHHGAIGCSLGTNHRFHMRIEMHTVWLSVQWNPAFSDMRISLWLHMLKGNRWGGRDQL